MKIFGIILFLIGSVVLLIGLAVCISTLTSDYASATCAKAAQDEAAIREAKMRCRLDNDCFRQATIGMTHQTECDDRKAFMNNQLIMGIVPSVIGGLMAFLGVLLTVFGFIRARKKGTAST